MDRHALCVAFRKLGNQEFQVFERIYADRWKKYHGSYSDLGREIGIEATNARKAVLKLIEYGVLVRSKIDGILFIPVNWEANLIANTANVKNPNAGVKRPRKNNN